MCIQDIIGVFLFTIIKGPLIRAVMYACHLENKKSLLMTVIPYSLSLNCMEPPIETEVARIMTNFLS